MLVAYPECRLGSKLTVQCIRPFPVYKLNQSINVHGSVKPESSKIYRSDIQCNPNSVQILQWTPGFSNETSLSNVNAEKIHQRIDCFDFLNFYGPWIDIFGWRNHDHLPVLLCMPKQLKHRESEWIIFLSQLWIFYFFRNKPANRMLLFAYRFKIFHPSHHLDRHFPDFLWIFGTREHSGFKPMKSFQIIPNKLTFNPVFFKPYASQTFFTLCLSCSPW